jgi:3-hydroxybutyryl-CoA dehydratase
MIFQQHDKFELNFIVTDKIYEGFITLFEDRNPLHTDEVFAKEKGFKGKVMHGNMLNGFLSYFIGECLPVKNVIIHSQEIKYNNAVYLGDELVFRAAVSDIFESVNAVEFKFDFKKTDSTTVAKGKIQIGLI